MVKQVGNYDTVRIRYRVDVIEDDNDDDKRDSARITEGPLLSQSIEVKTDGRNLLQRDIRSPRGAIFVECFVIRSENFHLRLYVSASCLSVRSSVHPSVHSSVHSFVRSVSLSVSRVIVIIYIQVHCLCPVMDPTSIH